jgi:hypothetical protein
MLLRVIASALCLAIMSLSASFPKVLISISRVTTPGVGGLWWCPQPLLPSYKHYVLSNCKTELMVSSSSEYKEFESSVCSVLTNHSMFVRFANVDKYFFKGPSSRISEYLNGAYMLLKWALVHLMYPPDLFLEFGVAAGFSANITAELRHRQHPRAPAASRVWGFDWFRGLPEKWSDGPQRASLGAFSQNGVLPPVAPQVQLVPGLFNETLEPFLGTHPGTVAFANFDMDLYGGAVYVLQQLVPRLRVGSILHFHELLWTKRGGRSCRGAEELRALWQVLQTTPALQLELLPLHQRDGASALFVVTAV